MSTKSLILKPIDQTKINIPIGIPPEKPTITGWITGIAIIHPKPLIKKFWDLVADDELHEYVKSKEEYAHLHERIEKDDITRDELLLRLIYTGFEGLGDEKQSFEGEAAWDEILNGKLSSYLTPAVMQRYYEQYGEAQKGNSKKSRKR